MNQVLSALAIALTLLMPVAIALQFSAPAQAQFVPPDNGGPDQTAGTGTR